MTDLQKLKTLFDEFQIGYKSNDRCLLLKEGGAKIGGYSYFYTSFDFDEDGEFTEVGAYE